MSITGLWAQQQSRSAPALHWWEVAREEGEQASSWSDHTLRACHGQGLLSSTCWPCIYNGIALGSVSSGNELQFTQQIQPLRSMICSTLWIIAVSLTSYAIHSPILSLMEMAILFSPVLDCPWKALFTTDSFFQTLLYGRHCVNGITHVTIVTGQG